MKDGRIGRMGLKSEKEGFLGIWLLLLGFAGITAAVLWLHFAWDAKLYSLIGKELEPEEVLEVAGRNSPLTEYVYLTGNADFPRKGKIMKITIHHMGGDFSLEELGKTFARRDRRASANYAIDSGGKVALYVEECNRAWTSGSRENDHQAVTIEVANDQTGGEWHVSDRAYEALIELCVDICRRNGIEGLVFTGDEQGNLTMHKMFSSRTECPGPYLESRMADIAAEVSARLYGGEEAEK